MSNCRNGLKFSHKLTKCFYFIVQAQKNGYEGPVIGVKMAEENKRQFTEEQLAEGKKVIGLQYGTNRGSSQKGMTPYGMTRKM